MSAVEAAKRAIADRLCLKIPEGTGESPHQLFERLQGTHTIEHLEAALAELDADGMVSKKPERFGRFLVGDVLRPTPALKLWLESVEEAAQADSSPRAADQALVPCQHSEDFRSVLWFGTNYTFTATQAACVSVLWRAWEQGTPDVAQATILQHVEVDAAAKRLVDIFRERKSSTYHPAWRTMIVKGSRKGTYRLNPPKK
jgi:hypothetical protein